MSDERLARFQSERPRLFGLAYRMLGSASEAEDVLQEAWIRFARADVESPSGWLTTVVSRLCLDALGSARARRETYVGPWLPEPVLVDEPDASADTARFAFVHLLERLSPTERAVLVLHEAFGYGFREIGETIDKSEANCRQLHRRARDKLADAPARPAPAPEVRDRLVGAFLLATRTGDLAALKQALREDVVLVSDGGGRAQAALRPIQGADRVARFFVGLVGKLTWEPRVSFERLNGEPALLLWDGERLDQVMYFEPTDAGIAAIHVVRNPDKLAWLIRRLGARS